LFKWFWFSRNQALVENNPLIGRLAARQLAEQARLGRTNLQAAAVRDDIIDLVGVF
jgi:hypothetical protein